MRISPTISRKLSNEQLDFLNRFFRDCPEDFASNLICRTYPKNHTMMNAGDSCSHVYLLLSGRLQAVEESVADDPYNFMEISAIDIVGDYELFQQLSSRIITLTTMESSTCLAIPSIAYFSWIRHDANALFMRIQKLICQTSSQARFDRQNFFLDNQTRLIYFFFTESTRKSGQEPPFQITYTRLQISQKLGCSIRTVNRNILMLKNEGLITLSHGKILITQQQYSDLQEYLRRNMPGYHPYLRS